MKKIAVLSVLFIGMLLGAYYGLGYLTERNLKKNLSFIQDSDRYKITIVNYKRGFFSSNAIVNVEVVSSAKVIEKDGKRIFHPASTYFTALPLTIYHGPIIVQDTSLKFGLGVAKSHIIIPSHYIKNFKNKYSKDSNKPELNINIFVNFSTNTVIRISSPKFSLIANDKNSGFEWLGMNSKIAVNSDLKDIDGSLDIKGISWMQDKMLTVLQEVRSSFKLYKGEYDLYLGESTVNVPSVAVSKDSSKFVEITNLSLKSNSYLKDLLFNSSLQASVDNIFVNNKTYKNCTMDLYIRNLDTKKLIDINNVVKRAQNGTDSQQKQAILSILPDLPELLNKGAEIELSDFNVDMDAGNIRANFILSLPKDENKNPFYLIQKTRGDGHIQISQALLKKTLQELYAKADIAENDKSKSNGQEVKSEESNNLVVSDAHSATTAIVSAEDRANNKILDLINRGAIVVIGDNYVLDLKIIQGRLIINDKPFSMELLRL